MIRDFSLSALVAGFVTVLVGYGSSAVIVFEAARASGAGPEGIGSWLWALGLGMALTCIGLSLRYRQPVVTAWSTPGAALLATTAVGLPLSEAIGAFVVAGVLATLAGVTGWFERMMSRVPVSLASGMLAGVLLRFGMDAFASMQTRFGLVLAMFAAYLAGRRWWPRYAVPGVLGLGLAVVGAGGQLDLSAVPLDLAYPVFTMPSFTAPAIIGVAIPLFVVTMASQNVPGVATMRACGYDAPVSPLIGWTGLATVLLAPFGGYMFNLAAITAAICMGREAHEDPRRRYMASVAAGGFYLIAGLFGATVAALLAAFPREGVLAVAGLALINTIGSGLAAATRDEAAREPAVVTFLITASGLSLFGIGSAFWGLVGGLVAQIVLARRSG